MTRPRSIRASHYGYEHMFSPRSLQRIGTALLEVAEAMLAPLPPEEQPEPSHEARVHPRPTGGRGGSERRPGAPENRAHSCTSPVASRPQSATVRGTRSSR